MTLGNNFDPIGGLYGGSALLNERQAPIEKQLPKQQKLKAQKSRPTPDMVGGPDPFEMINSTLHASKISAGPIINPSFAPQQPTKSTSGRVIFVILNLQ